MRRIFAIGIITGLICHAQAVLAAPTDVNRQQTARATVSGAEILAVRFADAAEVGIPEGGDIIWTNIDPAAGNLIRPTNHVNGKLDTGIVVTHNSASVSWNVKMRLSGTLVIAGESKVKYDLPQPINKNTNTATNGTTVPANPPAAGVDWPKCPATLSTIYTSNNDTINTPFGTLVAMDVALDPTSLVAGQTYTANILFTATVNP